ncbi:MAG: amidohydrolase [bacterium]
MISAPDPAPATSAPADLIVLAPVWTGVSAAPSAEAVAIRGDRIVGLDAAARSLRGPATRMVEAADGLVVPGFQDAHVHPPTAGRKLLTVDLDPLDGGEAYLRAVGEYAAAHPQEEWIVGGGWAMEHFPGGTPRAEDLDAVVPDRPVFLFNRDVHGAWVNSAALARAGIDARTPDPPDGRIERAAGGAPTGTLHEGAAYSFETRHVPAPTAQQWQEALSAAQAHLHALGITGWQDAWVTPDTQDAYRSLAAAGRLTARVVGALWWDRHRGLEQIDELLTRREQSAPGFFPTTVKIMLDGVLENGTGALLESYCDGGGGFTGERGLTYVEDDVMTAAVTELDRAGFQVHVHAIGDRAVRGALDAFATARAANGPLDNRHHIAHLQLIQPRDVPRFAELGVTANCQTYWAQHEPQMDELTIPFLGPERSRMQYPFADLLRTGARLAMGSDWSVTTADPLQQIEVAVRRVDPDNREREPFLPEQRLELAVALAAFTAGSAWINHDDEAGVIAVGRRADLAVLDRDLFAPDVLPTDARVTHAVASGRVVAEA